MFKDEKDMGVFKEWLTGVLKSGPVTVVFTKKNGDNRQMRCTIRKDLVKESDDKTKKRKVNEEVMPVYDLDAGDWRSFRWDSIKEVRLSLA